MNLERRTDGASEGRLGRSVGDGKRSDRREGEGDDKGERRPRGRTAPPADDANRQAVRVRRAEWQGEPARPVRGPPAAVRLQLHVRAEPGGGLRWVLHG